MLIYQRVPPNPLVQLDYNHENPIQCIENEIQWDSPEAPWPPNEDTCVFSSLRLDKGQGLATRTIFFVKNLHTFRPQQSY